MTLFDMNLLVYAHREDAPGHAGYRDWLLAELNSPKSFAVSTLALSGFIRVVTHAKVFKQPSPLGVALQFADAVLNRDNAVAIQTGERHWQIFSKLCSAAAAKGNMVPNAYLAALAIEHGCTFATADRDYTRFKDLNLQIVAF